MSKTKTNKTIQSRQRDNTSSVLIVDNDPEAVRFILQILARKGIGGNWSGDEKTALELLENTRCDLIFISERTAKGPSVKNEAGQGSQATETGRQDAVRGFELLEKIQSNMPEMPVIMMVQTCSAGTPNAKTGPFQKSKNHELKRTVATAVKAIRLGCYDFMTKPLDREKIEDILDTFLPNHKVSTIDSGQENARCLYTIVGKSPQLIHTVELAKRTAPTSAPVLISGESGTGKELISYILHYKSRRIHGAFIKVNCAALSDSLLESELFGHEKGAFTGAYSRRRGRFEMAHGGTLLLDEITETPPKFQAKLLRVLEQQDFERVGGNENIKVDVRIISTTNKNLLQEVQQGRFRQDLYYRLSGIRLVVAPLRQRKEDLPELVWYFVNLYARESQRHITKLDPLMMNIFAKYHWPGNVRQLRNVVRTSLILGSGESLSLADVSWLLEETTFCNKLDKCERHDLQPNPEQTNNRNEGYLGTEKTGNNSGLGGVPLEQLERQAILDTLDQTAGNQTKAAKILGISDRTLRDRIRRYRRQGCLQSV